jgi:capsular polysaccharide export protein
MDGDRRDVPRYLFLQGMATPFLGKLGSALFRRGYAVKRINFNAGDRLFWHLPGSIDYRGTAEDWPVFLEKRLLEWGISDIILFGDCRPLHTAAIRVASRHGVTVHVAEEGYLRPNWITLATGGVNGNSALPRDPTWFGEEAALLPAWDGGIPIRSHFWWRAVWDVIYHVGALLSGWYYPGYRTHLALNPFREYAGWIGRFVRLPKSRRMAHESMQVLNSWKGKWRYYLFPLQLESDSQVRFHSPFRRLAPALDHIFSSFAQHAPSDARLVVKEHPLDPGVTDWREVTAKTAARFGIADRVLYVTHSRVEPVMLGCDGVITLNSTVGFLALSFSLPVIALGKAIYDMPGLTFQGGLDRFWHEAARPAPMVFDAFRRVVADRTQINGGFFSREGLRLAVAGAVERLEHATARRPLIVALPFAAERALVEDEILAEQAPGF